MSDAAHTTTVRPQLVTSGKAFAGWKSIRLRYALTHGAAALEVSSVDLPPAVRDLPIYVGERCELLVGEDSVFSGHIDVAERAISATEHTLQLSARSLVADLVDCSAEAGSGQWFGLDVQALAEALTKPYGVRVAVDYDVRIGAPLESFALQHGESVFEAISRAARLRGLLLTSDMSGQLLITQPGVSRAFSALRVGDNVLSANVRADWRNRFSTYTMKGQAPGSDYLNGKEAAGVRAVAKDKQVSRHRPLTTLADCPDTRIALRERAEWECSVRASRALDVDVEVLGWRMEDGAFWKPNQLVWFDAPAMGLNSDLLIHTVDFLLDDRGQRTRIGLTRPDAYELEPIGKSPKFEDASKWFTKPSATSAGQ